MRVLYVHAQQASPECGDQILDRRVMEVLGDLVRLHSVTLLPGPDLPAMWRSVTRGLPPYSARYRTRKNRKRVAKAVAEVRPDRVILSHLNAAQYWEDVTPPAQVILHNLDSDVFGQRDGWFDRLSARMARRVEERVLRAPEILVLSERDRALVDIRTGGRVRPAVLLPGMPPNPVTLRPNAGFDPRVVIGGTYDWRLKRQDLERFVAEWGSLGSRVPLAAGAAARSAAGSGRVEPLEELDLGEAVRVGLITDRFVGGFKLKTLQYVANNCAVASLCELGSDFEGLPHANRFVRRFADVGGVEAWVSELAGRPPEPFVAAFREFKTACSERFNWGRNVANVLLDSGGTSPAGHPSRAADTVRVE